jgi:hypothetical protein
MRSQITTIAASSGDTPITTARGYLTLIQFSHSQTAAQTVTLKDRLGYPLARHVINPSQAPQTVYFPRHSRFRFTNGLTIDPAACVVTLHGAW